MAWLVGRVHQHQEVAHLLDDVYDIVTRNIFDRIA